MRGCAGSRPGSWSTSSASAAISWAATPSRPTVRLTLSLTILGTRAARPGAAALGRQGRRRRLGVGHARRRGPGPARAARPRRHRGRDPGPGRPLPHAAARAWRSGGRCAGSPRPRSTSRTGSSPIWATSARPRASVPRSTLARLPLSAGRPRHSRGARGRPGRWRRLRAAVHRAAGPARRGRAAGLHARPWPHPDRPDRGRPCGAGARPRRQCSPPRPIGLAPLLNLLVLSGRDRPPRSRARPRGHRAAPARTRLAPLP